MAVLIIMPKQGQSVESCIISEISRKKGDSVKTGDIIFVYETDKASFEEVAPADGVILECFYGEGDEVPVLSNMMIIGQPGEDYSSLLGDVVSGGEDRYEAASSDPVPSAVPFNHEPIVNPAGPLKEANQTSAAKSETIQNSFVSPRARKMAEKEAIDAGQLTGSGAKSRVMEKDVAAAAESRGRVTPLAKSMMQQEKVQTPATGSGLGGTIKSTDLQPEVNQVYGVDFEDKKLSNVRKLIAKSMHQSLQNSAQLTHHLGADARRIMELRRKIKAAVDAGAMTTNITLNDLICFAVIKTLKQYPNVNSHFMGDSMRLFHKVHLGLAVDTDRGLMVPVIKNADDLSITGLANQMKGIAEACRKGGISPDLLSPEAATFTVSNLGNYGVEMFTPVINLPQSAILGVNTIIPRPKDLGDGVYGFVPYLGLSLTYDHRSLDGGEATRFLKQLATEIENLELDIF